MTIVSLNKYESKLDAALALGTAGFKVFPVDKHKKPMIKGWPAKATSEQRQIKKCFERSNPPNIGVMTGHQSGPHGLLCLDVDGAEGLASLDELEGQYGKLERVCVAETPSGGLHIFFQMPPNLDIRNSAGKLGRGLDVRGNGGYVVVVPSQVYNRQNKLAPYEWQTEITLADGLLPKPPDWLLALLAEKAAVLKPTMGNDNAYGQKVLDDECQSVAMAIEGKRNDALNKAAFAVFQLVSGGAIDSYEAELHLFAAARCCGLGEREINATIKSAKAKAALSPRAVPDQVQSTAFKPVTRLFKNELPPAPLEVFPPKIQKMLKEAAVAFKNLPIEIPIVALLALLAGCVGRSRVVSPKEGWEEAGNIYLSPVANSGLGKSPCFKAFMAPLWKLELKNKERFDLAMASYNAIMEERRQCKDRDLLSDPPPRPVRIQYIIEDATTEAIGSILADNPRGLLWLGDELATMFFSFDRYSGSKGATKARLLSTYDGSTWKTSRRDNEKDQVIASAVLSMVGTVQPRILKELFGQSDAQSGLLPRFIFILAKRDAPGLLTDEIFTGQEILEKIANHLLSWEMDKSGGQPVPRKIKITPEAYKIYEDWHNQIMREAWFESETDNAIASKLVTQILRIALLLHSLKAALDESDGLNDLEPETMQGAIKFGWWIRAHQRRIWSALGIQKEAVQSSLEVAIIKSVLESESDLAANQWRMLNDDFNRLVSSKYSQPLDLGQLGREASRLGIAQCHIGKKRGKLFSPELLEDFKRKMFL